MRRRPVGNAQCRAKLVAANRKRFCREYVCVRISLKRAECFSFSPPLCVARVKETNNLCVNGEPRNPSIILHYCYNAPLSRHVSFFFLFSVSRRIHVPNRARDLVAAEKSIE